MKLYGEPGWGSTLVEAQLVWYGLDYELERVGDLFESAEARRRLERLNPLAQIPTLVLPSGEVMTESAATTLHLGDLTGSGTLVPPPGDRDRAKFLRWLVFLVANVYPTYTYADDPSRFVREESARQSFREAVDAYAKRLYSIAEGAAAMPWFLGERFSALDIYCCTMTRWRPRRPWFAENAPKLFAIASATDERAELAEFWRRSFP
jgi:GST-like protein